MGRDYIFWGDEEACIYEQKNLDTKSTKICIASIKCRSGEIGRRSGLKILRVLARAGSSPAFGTIFFLTNGGRIILFVIAIYLANSV